ncbi:hypothetical protein D3C77_600200 [compost metagenome]
MTPTMVATAPVIPSRTVRDGSATESFCLCRSAASVSTCAPTVAADKLVTLCQPSVMVAILLIWPGPAATAPTVAQVAVTVISPEGGMVTESGSIHLLPASSWATPWVIPVPACPTILRSACELVGTARPMPLILTLLDSPAPCAVLGEKEK